MTLLVPRTKRPRSLSRPGAALVAGAMWLALGCGTEPSPKGAGGASGSGGASSGGLGAGGADQTGGFGGSSGAAGAAIGGTGVAGSASGAPNGGSSGAGPTGGTPSGGSSGGENGGGGGASGAASGASGGGGVSGSGAGEGGSSGGAAGASGGGKSGMPVPPTSGVPKPSGTPDGMRVLDWAGFDGAVSYTFDDSNSSQIQNYAALQALGVRMTFYLQTGKMTESSHSVWAQAVMDGHELGNHTKSHLENGTGQDIDDATAFIESTFGVSVWTMAAPYGATVYADLARPRFLINRGVSNSLILPNGDADPYNLPCYVPPTGASAATMNAQIDSAASGGGWRVVLLHGFSGGSDGAYQPVALSEFVAHVNHAKSLGSLWIDTVVNVGAYFRAQKVVSALTPTTSGADKTWTWTLPDHFPPGMYLRVTVDGGTLRQGGTTLAWDDHGYYEVALDAGSVTLSP